MISGDNFQSCIQYHLNHDNFVKPNTLIISPIDSLPIDGKYKIKILKYSENNDHNILGFDDNSLKLEQDYCKEVTTVNFVLDGIRPTVVSTSPADNSSLVSVSDNISITFSEAMDTTTITTNTSNTSCSGSIQVSSDNFSTCVKMAYIPTSSNSIRSFTVKPASNLSSNTNYKIRVTAEAKDSSGNSITQWTMENGFTTDVTWGGTQQIGTSADDMARAITLDSLDNIFIVGITTGNLGRNNFGDNDTFLIKFKKDGTKEWVKQIGTPFSDRGWGIATDSSGYIYITGFTEGGSLDGNVNLGSYDIFLVKFSTVGEKLWTKQIGTSTKDYGSRLVVDKNNNIFLLGQTFGDLDGRTNYGGYDAFLMKFNSNGVKQWTQQFGTTEEDAVWGSDTDSSGNIYITGYTEGGLDGNLNSGGMDLFLFKYNMNGTNSSVRILGSSYHEMGKGVVTDSFDNIYVVAETNGGMDGYLNSGGSDIFLIKYNSSFTKIWSLQMGTTNDDVAQAITIDSSNNVYITGYTYGELDGNLNSGETDLFLLKFNSNGVKQWARQIGTSSFDVAEGLSVDSDNNILITGYTTGGLKHNTNFGDRDIFLLKYNSEGVLQTGDISIIDNQPPKISLVSSTNPDGKYKVGDNISISISLNEKVLVINNEFERLWTRQFGTTRDDIAYSVATDSLGNVYMAGETRYGLDGNTHAGNSDIFIAKFNSSGTKLWTKQMGSYHSDGANGVATDLSGNVYITGYTNQPSGTSVVGLDGNKAYGGNDTFLIKYDSDGAKQWTKQIGTSSSDQGMGVKTDSLGNIYVAGHTAGKLDNNTNSGNEDIFLIKFNSEGIKQWTKMFGTSSSDNLYEIALDTSDNIYLAGFTFGGMDGNSHLGERDIFVVKYNSSGSKLWSRQTGTSMEDNAYGISTDLSGNVILAGSTRGAFEGYTSFGYDEDLFVIKYSSNGTMMWTRQLGTTADDSARGVAIDSSGNIFVNGYTAGEMDGNTKIGDSDIFIIKYNSAGKKLWSNQIGDKKYKNLSLYAYGIDIDSFRNLFVVGSTGEGLHGNLHSGSADPFIIKFSGPPTLQLETGTIDQHAFYSSGNNTNTLTFNYTVQPNDNSSDLNYTSTSALKLNSGSIQDAGVNLADLTLPALDSSASLGGSKNIVVDVIRPTVVSTSPADNSSSIVLDSSISVTFSEPMDVATITTNTSNTSCSGSLQVSSDSFSTCVQMSSSPTSSNSNKSFSVKPSSGLLGSTNYKIRVTSAAKDTSGNSLTQWNMDSGFDTKAINNETNSNSDNTPPVLTQASFEYGNYNAESSGFVKITATDDISGIKSFQGTCWSILSESGDTQLDACGNVTILLGNQYKIPFTIGKYVENGKYYLTSIVLNDDAGNSVQLTANAEKTFYKNTSISVPSMTISN